MEEHLTTGEVLIKRYRRTRLGYFVHYTTAVVIILVGYYLYAYLSLLPLAVGLIDVLGLWMIGLGIVFIFLLEVNLWVARLYVTNFAATERRGLISRNIKTVDYEDISSVRVGQNPAQRIMHYGTLHVNTVEPTKGKKVKEEDITFEKIKNPLSVKELIEEEMRKRPYLKR